MKRYDIGVCEKAYFVLKLSVRSSLQIARAQSRENVMLTFFQVACVIRILRFLLLNHLICAK